MNINQFISKLEEQIHKSLKQKYLLEEGFSQGEIEQSETLTPIQELKLTGQAQLATEFLKFVGDKVAYDGKSEQWYTWNNIHWEAVKKEDIAQLMINFCEEKKIDYKSDSNLNGAVSLVSKKIRQRKWKGNNSKGFIPFQNGYLNIKTRELIKDFDFFKRYSYTYCLPYNYPETSVLRTTGNVLEDLKKYHKASYDFFMKSQEGDEQRAMKCLSVFNGVLTGILHDLQKFVLAIGKPATGKTTCSKLMAACLGKDNYAKRKFSHLGKQFGLAGVSDKKVLFLGDEEPIKKHSKEAGMLKDLSGDNEFYEEKKFKDGETVAKEFVIWASANENPFPDYDAALERRKCILEFNYQIPVEERRHDYLEELTANLGDFIAVILSIPQTTVIDYLKGVNQGSESKYKAWEAKVNDDPIANWMEENIIFNPQYEGVLLKDLYKLFKSDCEECGLTPCTSQSFSKQLMSISEFLGHNLTKGRVSSGMKIGGLALRTNEPTILESLKQKSTSMHNHDNLHVDNNVDQNPHPERVCVEDVENVVVPCTLDCVSQSEDFSITKNDDIQVENQDIECSDLSTTTESSNTKIEDNLVNDTDCILQSSVQSTTKIHLDKNGKRLKIGQTVKFTWGLSEEETQGEIMEIRQNGFTGIKLPKNKHLQWQPKDKLEIIPFSFH